MRWGGQEDAVNPLKTVLSPLKPRDVKKAAVNQSRPQAGESAFLRVVKNIGAPRLAAPPLRTSRPLAGQPSAGKGRRARIAPNPLILRYNPFGP